jgi:glycosyltransferase involved in cell wall biosynthesis
MEVKGIEQYLNCANTIKKKYPCTNFYIAGFIEEDRYKRIINDYHKKAIVIYLGFQKNIKSWIKKCHCTILPSYGGEGVPNVLLESAAMGRVCIASDINGSKEVIDNGVTGYLFETGDSDDLINKVEIFLSLEYEKKEQMGIAGRKKVEKEYDRNVVVKTYMDEINKPIENTK